MANAAEQKNQLKLIAEILKTHTFLTKFGGIGGPASKSARALYERLLARFGVVEQNNEFSKCFAGESFDSFNGEEKVFILKEIEKEPHILPVLGLNYATGDKYLAVNIRVGLFQFSDHTNPKSSLLAFGYRFESPSPKAGSHNFFHSQPIVAFKRHDPRLALDGSPWITETQPSFPLDAKCPITLLVACLVTIYGKSCIDVILSEQNLRDRFIKKVKDLHFAVANLPAKAA